MGLGIGKEKGTALSGDTPVVVVDGTVNKVDADTPGGIVPFVGYGSPAKLGVGWDGPALGSPVVNDLLGGIIFTAPYGFWGTQTAAVELSGKGGGPWNTTLQNGTVVVAPGVFEVAVNNGGPPGEGVDSPMRTRMAITSTGITYFGDLAPSNFAGGYGMSGHTVTLSAAGAITAASHITGQTLKPSGAIGATTASRYVGAIATAYDAVNNIAISGYIGSVGDWVVALDGNIWIYTGGSSWVKIGGGGGIPTDLDVAGRMSYNPGTTTSGVLASTTIANITSYRKLSSTASRTFTSNPTIRRTGPDAVVGQTIVIENVNNPATANYSFTFTHDAAGTSTMLKLKAATRTIAPYQSIMFMYDGSYWVEIGGAPDQVVGETPGVSKLFSKYTNFVLTSPFEPNIQQTAYSHTVDNLLTANGDFIHGTYTLVTGGGTQHGCQAYIIFGTQTVLDTGPLDNGTQAGIIIIRYEIMRATPTTIRTSCSVTYKNVTGGTTAEYHDSLLPTAALSGSNILYFKARGTGASAITPSTATGTLVKS